MDFNNAKTIESILPNADTTTFIIQECKIEVHIDNDLKSAEFIHNYVLEKIRGGDDSWIITSKCNDDNFEFINSQHQRNILHTILLPRKDDKVSYFIQFDKKLEVNDVYRFSIKFKEDISYLTKFDGNSFLYKDFIYNFHNSFANHCNLLSIDFFLSSDNLFFFNNWKKNQHSISDKMVPAYDSKIENIKIRVKKLTRENLIKYIISFLLIILGAVLQIIFNKIL